MSNNFYNHGSFPTTGSAATSASMRAELDSIAAGFDKMPTLTGNANEIVVVNGSGTALTAIPTLPATSGGTGLASYAVGDLLYAATTTALAKLADIATGNALISGGVGVAPSWGKIGLTTHVTGTLPATNGGTGQASYAVGDLLFASTTTALSKLADVATGNALISGGVGVAPSYGKIGLTTHVSGTLPTANGGTNLTSFTANGVVYASSTSALATGSAFTFDGNGVVVSVNSSSDALRITQTGTGNCLVVEDSANPDATPFVINSAGSVIRGYTATIASNLGTGTLQSIGSDINSSALTTLGLYSATASRRAAIEFVKSATNTIDTQAQVANNETLALIQASGSDGAAFIPAASISAFVDGTPGTNDMPGRLVFSTTADGASSPTERMRIDSAGQVGVGTTPTVGRSFSVSKPLVGTSTVFGILQNGQVQSDVTTIGYGIRNDISTAAATFTLPNYNHFFAQQNTLGAGSVITSQFGFHATSSLIGATNNYGFYSNIASGTGRWNFYASGTAENFFGGNTTISVNSTSDALRITQVGTGNALVVEDSANPDSTPFVVNADGKVLVGHSTSFASPLDRPLSVAYGAGSGIGSYRFSADSIGTELVLSKSRSATVGTNTVVQSGDAVAYLSFYGADGTSYISAAQIRADVDGTPGTNDMPGRLVFSTTADGASAPTERMRIDSAGRVGYNGSPAASAINYLNQNITGGTTARLTRSTGMIQSDVTASATYFQTLTQTQATAFTATSVTGYEAAQGTLGLGSAITNQYGFNAASSLTGATNNYGFYSNIAAGTGRWNFYANGTADNYFAGNVGIGTSSPACALDVVGGIQTSRTAVTAPAATDGNVFSGTYTPTLTNGGNVAASTANINQYMRVGNVVTVSGFVTIDPTSANVDTILDMSLPVASAMTSARQVGGTAALNTSFAGAHWGASIYANTTGDTARFFLRPGSAGSVSYSFSFTYLVV